MINPTGPYLSIQLSIYHVFHVSARVAGKLVPRPAGFGFRGQPDFIHLCSFVPNKAGAGSFMPRKAGASCSFYILPSLSLKGALAAKLDTHVWQTRSDLACVTVKCSVQAARQSRCFSSSAIRVPEIDYFSLLISVERFFGGWGGGGVTAQTSVTFR